jgi:hypothetical protein
MAPGENLIGMVCEVPGISSMEVLLPASWLVNTDCALAWNVAAMAAAASMLLLVTRSNILLIMVEGNVHDKCSGNMPLFQFLLAFVFFL